MSSGRFFSIPVIWHYTGVVMLRPPLLLLHLGLSLLHATDASSVPVRDPASSFDGGWRFRRGHSPDDGADLRPSIPTPRRPACAYDIDVNATPCISDWFAHWSTNGSAAACAASCCALGGSCDAWQFCPARGAPCSRSQPGCWLGRGLWQWHCAYQNGSGWVGAGRHPAGTRAPSSLPSASSCATTYCSPEYDDSNWRVLAVPHDFSSEDLPSREQDADVAPALAPRAAPAESPWLFHPGDDPHWANASSDAAGWTVAAVPRDWRRPPLSYNGTRGWYRRRLRSADVPRALLRANWTYGSGARLALGIVCGSDQTYLNGVLLGATAWPADPAGTKALLQRYATPRVYLIPQGLLRGDGTDVVAVRVDANGPPTALALPRGLADISYYGPDGQHVPIGDVVRNGAFSSDASSVHRLDSDTADFTEVGWTLGDNPRSSGYVTTGQGWYRKSFVLAAAEAAGEGEGGEGGEGGGGGGGGGATGAGVGPSERVSLLFDGVYGLTDAWLNGHYLGRHIYGYTAFSFDLTAHLSPPGKENVLAVRVSNLGATSRWYSGSGIFRSVALLRTPVVHVAQWGITVTPSEIRLAPPPLPAGVGSRSEEAACVVTLVTTLVNDGGGGDAWSSGNVSVVLSGGLGAATAQIVGPVSKGATTTVTVSIPIESIALWSPESPNLHTATVTTSLGEQHNVSFGVKLLHHSAATGLVLNGAPLKLRGGCCHHDHGPLGSASIGSEPGHLPPSI